MTDRKEALEALELIEASMYAAVRQSDRGGGPAQATFVQIPKNADQAELMLKMGHMWLADNAPERLAAPPAAVPQGWKLVPVEPTVEMLAAMDRKLVAIVIRDGQDYVAIWKAMLAAAPSPSAAVPQDQLDAARYRHMRASAAFQDRHGPGIYWYLPRWNRDLPLGERLDVAIDDAMRAAAPSPTGGEE